MALPRSKVTARGQISVPAEIRRKLGIGSGSVLEWDDEGGRVFIRKVGRYSVEDVHRALFPEPPKPRTLDELKQGIEEYIKAKHARRWARCGSRRRGRVMALFVTTEHELPRLVTVGRNDVNHTRAEARSSITGSDCF